MISEDRSGRIVRLTLDNPPVNVLTTGMLERLAARLGELAGDESVAAVLLAGAGRCFSAGASVEEHRPGQAEAMVAALEAACRAIAAHPAPVVALVHDACLGGALELVAFCDFVVADPGARLGQPEIRLAFFPPLACWALPRSVGRQAAAHLVLTGETVDAARAREIGLVQEVLPRDRWDEVAERLAGLSTPVLRLAKRALGLGEAPAEEALPRLRELFLGPLYELEDVAEGIASFTERRRPQWRHR